MAFPRCTNPEHMALGRDKRGRCLGCTRAGYRRRQARFAKTDKGKAVQKTYWQTAKGQAARDRYAVGLKRALATSRYNRKQELQHALEAVDEVR